PSYRERLVKNGKAYATDPQFSRATRRYLARRAYRYFRSIARRNFGGASDPARYGKWLRFALALYSDAALATPAKLLDARGLVHALYHYSPALAVTARGFVLAHGKKLGELVPAPHFPAAWQGVFDDLFTLLVTARSRTVRTWTTSWLRSHHASELAALKFAHV